MMLSTRTLETSLFLLLLALSSPFVLASTTTSYTPAFYSLINFGSITVDGNAIIEVVSPGGVGGKCIYTDGGFSQPPTPGGGGGGSGALAQIIYSYVDADGFYAANGFAYPLLMPLSLTTTSLTPGSTANTTWFCLRSDWYNTSSRFCCHLSPGAPGQVPNGGNGGGIRCIYDVDIATGNNFLVLAGGAGGSSSSPTGGLGSNATIYFNMFGNVTGIIRLFSGNGGGYGSGAMGAQAISGRRGMYGTLSSTSGGGGGGSLDIGSSNYYAIAPSEGACVINNVPSSPQCTIMTPTHGGGGRGSCNSYICLSGSCDPTVGGDGRAVLFQS